MEFSHTLDATSISELLGYPLGSMPAACAADISKADLRYRPLTTIERDEHILKVLTRIEAEKLQRTSLENIAAFEHGWRENLDRCRNEGLSAQNLLPGYVRPYSCIRFRSDLISPADPFLSNILLSLSVRWSVAEFCRDVSAIYEFGCGTGRFIYDLARLYPDRSFFGTDWTESSVELLRLMRDSGLAVDGARFDMLHPDSTLRLRPQSAVMTIGALEQIGDRFEPFLNYLLAQKPSIVIHHEPILDFYHQTNLVDYIGALYHRRRDYLHGYVEALRSLEKRGIIRILESVRVPFGDPYHESASRLVWEIRQ